MNDSIGKPINNKPVSKQSKNYEKNFNKITTMHGLNINEVDELLTEKEMSLKKKIFSLPKMEALVHPDPKLSAIYNEMAEDGEEKYGYHYNETIMNIIFNDYVLNSPKYLQKYRNAIPKKKKRRDKSGIRQLQKAAEKKIAQSKKDDVEKGVAENFSDGKPAMGKEPSIDGGKVIDTGRSERRDSQDNKLKNAKIKSVLSTDDLDETSTTGSVGGTGMGSGGYATPHAWGGGDLKDKKKKQKSPIQRKPIWNGGTIIGESNYLIETDGFKKYYDMLNEKAESKKQQRFMGMVRGVQKGDIDPKNVSQKVRKTAKQMKPEDVKDFAGTKHDKLPEKVTEKNKNMNEHHLTTNEDKVMYIINVNDIINPDKAFDKGTIPYVKSHFMSLGDEQIDSLYRTSEKLLQQKNIDPMSITVNENQVNEHHLTDRNSQVEWMIAADKQLYNGKNIDKLLKFAKSMVVGDDEINNLYLKYEEVVNEKGMDPMEIKPTDDVRLNENNDDEFIPHGTYTISNTGGYEIMISDDGEAAKVRDAFGSDNPKTSDWLEIEYLPNEETGELEPVIDPNGYNIELNQVMRISEETDQTMIGSNQMSMANKPKPEGEFGGGVPMGMQDSGGLRESDFDDVIEFNDDEIFEVMNKELNEELNAFSIHHNKLKSIVEDKKHPSMVNLERKRSENKSNTKSNMKNSPVKDVINMEKNIMWKDQQTDVSKNPYKNGEELEKGAIKATKGNALKNAGNSDGSNGEIPKRNLTTKEQEEVDLYRLGQQDLVYDNQPDEKFEERMKAGMGEKMYKKRKEHLKKRTKYPMYNKDSQPIQDTAVDKIQFNKEKSGWNDSEGLNESVLTGKYNNELNKRKLVDFKLSDVKIVESVNDMFNIDFTGIGNAIDSRGNINKALNNIIKSHQFYTNGKTVVAMKNPVQNLNENKQKPKNVINEEYNKMKHLLNYNPKNYIDTKQNKI